MTKCALAIAAHPDDIEFMMSGTLMLLKNAGYEIHYMNIANGSCGTDTLSKNDIIKQRRLEAIEAAKFAGAIYHESLVDDLCIFYNKELLAKTASVIREIAPNIILTHMQNEYMEDHSNTSRLAVSGAFSRGMKNFPVFPNIDPIQSKVTIYHTLPYGLKDQFRNHVNADMFVDVSSLIHKKVEMLAFHRSQKDWLDVSQGMDSYLITLKQMCGDIGQLSGKFQFAEAWIQHLHQGFCDVDDNPLRDALDNFITENPRH